MTRRDLTVVFVGVLVLVVAGAVAFAPSLAFRSEEVRAGLESSSALIALLAAYLMVGRYMFSLALRDLALIGALTALALGSLAFSALPALLAQGPSAFGIWGGVGARLIAALAFVAAAFAPDLRIGSPRRAAVAMLAGTVAVLSALGLAILLAGDALPTDFGAAPADRGETILDAPLGFVAAQVVGLLLSAAAAVGFRRRALRTGDELLMWFAAASAIAAAWRLDYLLYPSVDPEVIASGDLLRLGFYLVLLGGALREIRRYQRRVAVAAVLDERRRMARDLHDGLAQELAYVVMQARRLAGRDGGDEAARVAEAAETALGESRRAITALSRRPDDSFEEAMAQVAGRLTSRAGVRLRLRVDAQLDLDSDRRDQVLNIVHEAVSNGVRHGSAQEVSISLTGSAPTRLTVTDDGSGFDADTPGGGFGLTAMRERAEALGGRLRVSSRPGSGTEISLELP